MRRGGSLGGWSKKVNDLHVFKKDTIIFRPYFGSLLQEAAALSKAAKNHAQPLRI
jgi:hypothetical protein